MAWDNVEWTPDSKTLWSTDLKCFVLEEDDHMDACEDSDSDWDPNDDSECSSSEDDDNSEGHFEEDVGWLHASHCTSTWDVSVSGCVTSTRQRFQHVPVDMIDLT